MRSYKLPHNAVDEVRELAIYVAGYAAGKDDERLEEAAEWLEKLSDHVRWWIHWV